MNNDADLTPEEMIHPPNPNSRPRLWARSIGLGALFGTAALNAAAVEFNLGGIDAIEFNYEAMQSTTLGRNNTVGQIFGGIKDLGEFCTLLGCIDLGTVDTRTGATFGAGAEVTVGYNVGIGLEMQAYDPGRTAMNFDSDFSHGDIRGDGFRSLSATSRLSTESFSAWTLGGPNFTASLGVFTDIDVNFKTRAYAAGSRLIDNSTSLGANVALDLLSVDTSMVDPLQFAPGLLNNLPSFSVEADAQLGGDTLVRKTFGGGTGPTGDKLPGALVISVLDPTESFEQSARNDSDAVVRQTSVDLLRAGIDILKLSPTVTAALTGNRSIGGGYSIQYDLAALELGVDLGYQAETRFSNVVEGATLVFDSDVALRDAGGNISIVTSGDTYHIGDFSNLPDVQVLDGGSVTATLSLNDVAIRRDIDHNIVVTPGGIVTLLPQADLYRNGNQVKVGPISLGIPELAQFSLKLDPGIAIPVGNTSDGVIINNILDNSITHQLTFTGLTREFYSYEPLTSPALPTANVLDPLTHQTREVDVIAVGSPEYSTVSNYKLFASKADRNSASIDIAVNPGYSVADTFGHSNPAIQRNLSVGSFGLENFQWHEARDLQLVNWDFGGIFHGVRIEEGRMLHVLNRDYVGDYDGGGNIIALNTLENDGLLYLQATNPNAPKNTGDRTLWMNPTALRTFTGKGRAVFDIDTRIETYNGGLFYQGAEHTTEITNGHYLWFYAAGQQIPNTAKVQNDGTIIANKNASLVFDTQGVPGEGFVNNGSILSQSGAITEFRRARTITNTGLIAASDGGSVIFDALSSANQFIEFFNDGSPGDYLADGVDGNGQASELEFKHRLFIRTGQHNINAVNGGEVHFHDGIGKLNSNEFGDGGVLNLTIGRDSRVTAGNNASFDGSVMIEEGGHGTFHQLAARVAGGLDITNRGTLEFLSGWNGTLPEPPRPVPRNPGPDYVPPVTLEPVNFANHGEIILHANASFNFAAEINEYSTNGVVFDSGSWDIRGGRVSIEVESPIASLELASVDGGIGSRDPYITHSRSDIRMAGNARWEALYWFYNDAGERTHGHYRDLDQTLTVNQGRLSLSNHHWDGTSRAIEFTNGGTGGPNLVGELNLDDNSIFTVDKFTNLGGVTNVRSGSSLLANSGEYVVQGGTINVDAGTFAGITVQHDAINGYDYFETAAGTSVTIADRATPEGAIAAAVNIVGSDGKDAAFRNNYANLALVGTSASLTGAEYLGYNAAGASLSLQGGTELILKYDEKRDNVEGFLNEGDITIGNGSILDVKGNYESAGAQFADGGRFTQSLDGMVTIEENGTLIARSVDLQGSQKHINNNGVLAVDDFELDAGSRLSGAGHVLGDFNAKSGATIAPGNSPGLLTHIGNAIYNSGSLLEMEIGGYNAGEFDAINVLGNLSLLSPDLGLVFDSEFVVDANNVLELVRTEPGTNALGEPIIGSGQLSGNFGDILVSGLLGFDGFAGSRFGAQANGGEFLGLYGNYDLFLFVAAGTNQNLINLAFLDGTISFINGEASAVPIPAPVWMLMTALGFLRIVTRR